MTRELIILVADGTMAAVMRAFFERAFHHALACAAFDFDPTNDIFNNPLEKDGGVHRRCHEILRPYLKTHRRALVVLDQQFGGERPAEEVSAAKLSSDSTSTDGMAAAAAAVIDPELEVLLWQDNPNVERAPFGTRGRRRSGQLLAQDGQLAAGGGMTKPSRPEGGRVQALIRANRRRATDGRSTARLHARPRRPWAASTRRSIGFETRSGRGFLRRAHEDEGGSKRLAGAGRASP